VSNSDRTEDETRVYTMARISYGRH
jgi:hypothetical protein